jgi:hypothetical protein
MNLQHGLLILVFQVFCYIDSYAQSPMQNPSLKVIIIRHAENPLKGDNLSCQGLNRSIQLPPVLYSKFGIPNFAYVPAIGRGPATKHARMFQTIVPMSIEYNLKINSNYDENDSTNIASEIKSKNGTVLIVWDHKAIPSIVRALGVAGFYLKWSEEDFDSIWIVTFTNGRAIFSADKEGLSPGLKCPGTE